MFTYSKNRTLNAQCVIVSVTEEIMARVDKWIEDSNNHNMGNVVFTDRDDTSVMYIIAHGTTNGKFIMGNKEMSCEDYLRSNYQKLHDDGVKCVLTISCFGYDQHSVTYKGIVMGTIHTFPFETYMQTIPSMKVKNMKGEVYDSPVIVSTFVNPSDGKYLKKFKNLFWKLMQRIDKWFPEKPRVIE